MLETFDYLNIFTEGSDDQELIVKKRSSVVNDDICRILLVEDEPLSQKYCKVLLESRGYSLNIAPDGEAALNIIAEDHFQAILMDIGLPGMCGIEVTEAIRSTDNPNRDVPIIAFTAHLAPSRLQACLEAGMTDFLVKPVSPTELCSMLDRLLVRVVSK